MTNNTSSPFVLTTEQASIDHFELLTNDRKTGPIKQIQLPKDLVTTVHGIMFDIDPKNFDPLKYPAVSQNADAFYQQVVSKWLGNSEVLKNAEVRMSGSGLHILLWVVDPIELSSESDQEKWDCVIKTVQACLPIDPGQPSITCCTRAIGSTNSKNGASVVQLAAGTSITQEDINGLYEAMKTTPFSTVCKILHGSDKVSTCPVCQQEGTSLSAFGHIGKCYKCKKVSLEQLYSTVFAPGNPGSEK